MSGVFISGPQPWIHLLFFLSFCLFLQRPQGGVHWCEDPILLLITATLEVNWTERMTGPRLPCLLCGQNGFFSIQTSLVQHYYFFLAGVVSVWFLIIQSVGIPRVFGICTKLLGSSRLDADNIWVSDLLVPKEPVFWEGRFLRGPWLRCPHLGKVRVITFFFW